MGGSHGAATATSPAATSYDAFTNRDTFAGFGNDEPRPDDTGPRWRHACVGDSCSAPLSRSELRLGSAETPNRTVQREHREFPRAESSDKDASVD